MKISAVYKIQSKAKPWKVYVGSSVDIKRRWYRHLNYLRKREHPNIKLQNHFDKYGESDLSFTIIEPCISEFLIVIEQHYIKKLRPQFNINPVAGSRLGTTQSKETREKLSIANKGKSSYWKGKHLSEETRRKLSEFNKGKRHSEETKLKIGRSNKGKRAGDKHPFWGKHFSEDHKRKISEANKKKFATKEARQKMREIALCQSEDVRRRISEKLMGHIGAMKGKHHTDETKRKMSATKKARHKEKMELMVNPN